MMDKNISYKEANKVPLLEQACDALTAWARERCPGCKAEMGHYFPHEHTCHKYIELARDVALAAVNSLRSDTVESRLERERLLAELKRLLGEVKNA